jgi:hypothetical protein
MRRIAAQPAVMHVRTANVRFSASRKVSGLRSTSGALVRTPRRSILCMALFALHAAAHWSSGPAVAQDIEPSGTTLGDDAWPVLPMPHPVRASAMRRTAYREMMRTWAQETATLSKRTALLPRSQPGTDDAAAQDTANSRDRVGAAMPHRPAAAVANAQSADTSRDDTQAADAPLESWSAQDIAAAEQQCDSLLASVAAETDRLGPLRHGACGLPLPLKLKRIGSGQGLSITPPVTTNCAMAARLYQWLETIAQPAAKLVLKSSIVKIRSASSYMCRNRYNDPAQKISEHAFANALDIAAFELADGRMIDVKTYWGLVLESAEAAKSAQDKAKQMREPSERAPGIKTRHLAVRAVTSGLADARSARTSTADTIQIPETAELTFLRALHAGACGLFSTVLGPNANRAHHDHFHLDLKIRRGSAYCE